MTDRQEVALKLLSEKLQLAKIGVLAKGLKKIDPKQLIVDFSREVDMHIYAAIIGYNVSNEEGKNYTISNSIEKAVLWRSKPECAGAIIVIIKDDVDKLHSLAEFDVLSMRDFSSYMIAEQIALSPNQPTRNFWDALLSESSYYSVDAIEKFIATVCADPNDAVAIPKSMWILNLLRDDAILNAKSKPLDRIKENRDLISAIGQLSAEATKRLSRSLTNMKGDDEKEELQSAYRTLQDYIRYGRNESLQKLDYKTVQRLMRASQKKGNRTAIGGEIPTINGEEGPSLIKSNDSMNIREVNAKIADMLFSGDPEDIEAANELYSKIKKHMILEDTDDAYITGISGPFDGKRVEVENNNTPLRQIIAKACSNTSWGAIITTEATTLKDAISDYNEFEPFNPSDKSSRITSYDGTSLFDFLLRFDELFEKEGYSHTIPFKPILEKLIPLRSELIENLDMLMYYAILTFKQDNNLCQTLFSYVEAWKDLYHAYRENYNALTDLSAAGSKFIAKELLILDTLFIKTPQEWKAVLLPLHPIYLWRYSEIFKMWNAESANLSKEDADAMKAALSNLPQVLNIVVASDIVTRTDHNFVLPYSGNIEMLPTFENKTNRYSGVEGIESIEEILTRWIRFAPFTENEIRICAVDVPSLTQTIRSVNSFISKTGCKRVVIDAFLTRNQNDNDELGHLDFTGKDHDILNRLKTGMLAISMHHVKGPAEVKKHLKQKPVHIAFFFDQSSYSVEYAPSHKNLYITPLVVTYDYSLDKATHRGTISPSTDTSSGLIGDYHRVMESADVIISDMNVRTTYNDTPEVDEIVSTISDGETQWLVVADRSTSYYMPDNSIPIGEKQYEHRIVSTWASADSRIIENYVKELGKYNLTVTKERIADILCRFGHIASCGLISIPRRDSENKATENMKKGLLGTLFAAVKYTKDYSDQNPLVASLDTSGAKTWLYDSKFGNERADLLGMRYDSVSNTLYVQPIEVKTRDESPDAQIKYNTKARITYLDGHAADQIAAVSNLLKEIFGLLPAESHMMFVSARREVLKYQIVSECFRKTHAPESQEQWEQVFRKAFGNGETGNINIRVSGILYHFKLSDSSKGNTVECLHRETNCQITIYTMTTPAIQEQIINDNLVSVDYSNPQATLDLETGKSEQNTSGFSILDNSLEGPFKTPSISSTNDIPLESDAHTKEDENSLQTSVQVTTGNEIKDAVFSKLDLHTVRFLLGKDIHTGEDYYWEFGNPSLNNRHLLINGNSGCGKTYCIETLLMEAALQGISSVVFDYTGGFANSKLDPLFKEKMSERLTQRIVKVSKIPINPFKKHETQIDEDIFIPETNVDIATKIAEIFSTVYSLGDQQKGAVYTAVNSGLSTYGDSMNFQTMAKELEGLGTSYSKSVLSKTRAFIDLDPFTSSEEFDWSSIRDSDGTVYIMQLIGYTRDVQILLTELMLWDIWSFCVKTGDENKPFILVLDEAQNLNHGENSPSAKILTEGRKFGISGWYATQFMKPQLTDDEIQRLQQAGQKLYFCPPDDGIVTVAKNIDISNAGAKEWADKLKRLKKGEAVTCGNTFKNGRWLRYNPKIIKITPFEDRV